MLNLSVVSTKETHITFASIVLMASLFLCTSAYAETKPNTNADSQIITTTPLTTKNYPPIAPAPLSSSLMSKTHELQQQALLMPRAMTKSPITTKNYPPIAPAPLSSSLMSKTHELADNKHCLCHEL